MAFDRDEKLLQEYSEWVILQRQRDTSPTTFLLDKGKEEAFEKLITAIDFIVDRAATADDEGNINGFTGLDAEDIADLHKILQGDDA